MPHIVVEYSRNLENHVKDSRLLSELQSCVTASGLFDKNAIKSRSIAYDNFVMPGNNENFIHITVSILNGRSLEARKALSSSLFTISKGLIPLVDKLSVDIREMDAETYLKN